VITMQLPGDKSIAHRALFLACLADGPSRIRLVPGSADVNSTRAALVALGAGISNPEDDVTLVTAPTDWTPGLHTIDCGNSGTTVRLLMGLLVGLGVPARLTGDESLRRRPMDRVVYPLQSMGGRITYSEDRDRLPIELDARTTGSLRVLRYRGRVASAQVKSSLLLAGLAAGNEVEVREPAVSRDHTERMLASLGYPIEFGPLDDGGARVLLADATKPVRLPGFDLTVPGDVSSAAFLIAAGLLSGQAVHIEGVGLNDTRTGFLQVLRRMGAEIRERIVETRLGEPVGTIDVVAGRLAPFEIEAEEVPALIDEIPVLAVLAARAQGISQILGAGELRLKESDRLAALASNLTAVGVECEERPDGLTIEGSTRLLSGTVRTGGDHRIAMAFGVLGRAPGCAIDVDDRACVNVSYPGFWTDLEKIASGSES
jgi:3-phosphoshikimate 1-carboxyvinyltransferase